MTYFPAEIAGEEHEEPPGAGAVRAPLKLRPPRAVPPWRRNAAAGRDAQPMELQRGNHTRFEKEKVEFRSGKNKLFFIFKLHKSC